MPRVFCAKQRTKEWKEERRKKGVKRRKIGGGRKHGLNVLHGTEQRLYRDAGPLNMHVERACIEHARSCMRVYRGGVEEKGKSDGAVM